MPPTAAQLFDRRFGEPQGCARGAPAGARAAQAAPQVKGGGSRLQTRLCASAMLRGSSPACCWLSQLLPTRRCLTLPPSSPSASPRVWHLQRRRQPPAHHSQGPAAAVAAGRRRRRQWECSTAGHALAPHRLRPDAGETTLGTEAGSGTAAASVCRRRRSCCLAGRTRWLRATLSHATLNANRRQAALTPVTGCSQTAL